MEQYDSILQQCGMFNGIQPRKYREVLRCLNATVREYPRGAHIVELGEQSHNTGVLMKMAIKSASAVFVPEKYLVQNWPVLAGGQVRSVCVPVRTVP